ncbi:pyrroline-5-carboxylate reductase [Aspergillus taichungensis]|uniref:Pyrroline-5-carboxylate reductase n=1 Tax=Aspergillus taichungensis TaxID=482145 RepID=A0A2J5HYU7_9EURO|nr:pyrroline-5-carboxylate reductase [Aspergillus taichungensis]
MSALNKTLCILGCGNLGTAILTSLIKSPPTNPLTKSPIFTNVIACVRSVASENKLKQSVPQSPHISTTTTTDTPPLSAVRSSSVIILAIDPADIQQTLTQPDLASALSDKLLISVAAGWTHDQLAKTLSPHTARIIRTLPNITAQVSESLTAIEDTPSSTASPADKSLTDAIFARIGRTVHVKPAHMDAITAVGGSTPAFFAVICDAMIDAAVAVGLPREVAQIAVFQAMKGSAAMMQSGILPAALRDQGTSPEGCTIAGVMVLEEKGVRGGVGRAVREAVSVARLMGDGGHVNDTRRE